MKELSALFILCSLTITVLSSRHLTPSVAHASIQRVKHYAVFKSHQISFRLADFSHAYDRELLILHSMPRPLLPSKTLLQVMYSTSCNPSSNESCQVVHPCLCHQAVEFAGGQKAWKVIMNPAENNGSQPPEYTGLYITIYDNCLLYTSPSPRDGLLSRMPSSA